MELTAREWLLLPKEEQEEVVELNHLQSVLKLIGRPVRDLTDKEREKIKDIL